MNSRPTVLLANLALGLIWIYQGLIPKILFPETGETEMLRQSGLFSGNESSIVLVIGWIEIAFGFVILLVHKKIIHILNIIALLILGAGSLMSSTEIFTYPFNPFSLNLSMIVISVIAILNLKAVPKESGSVIHP